MESIRRNYWNSPYHLGPYLLCNYKTYNVCTEDSNVLLETENGMFVLCSGQNIF